LGMGLLAGVVGGGFFAVVGGGVGRRNYTAAGVRKGGGVSGGVGVPALGGWEAKVFGGGQEGWLGGRRVCAGPCPPRAEARRGLHASVRSSRHGRPPQILLIASSLPDEGATSIAVGLAAALAQHSKVCLIDAHLRSPGVGRALGLLAEQGLGEVLAGSAF